ncbi:uncharacterized protein LOC143018377 [Oratosquilla oratoria]|uniref:uncharacterized protein LOC143018377 n=1 Tax=Oratosquilla oratoria TaxID=337810 RepID=UPI003F770CD5
MDQRFLKLLTLVLLVGQACGGPARDSALDCCLHSRRANPSPSSPPGPATPGQKPPTADSPTPAAPTAGPPTPAAPTAGPSTPAPPAPTAGPPTPAPPAPTAGPPTPAPPAPTAGPPTPAPPAPTAGPPTPAPQPPPSYPSTTVCLSNCGNLYYECCMSPISHDGYGGSYSDSMSGDSSEYQGGTTFCHGCASVYRTCVANCRFIMWTAGRLGLTDTEKLFEPDFDEDDRRLSESGNKLLRQNDKNRNLEDDGEGMMDGMRMVPRWLGPGGYPVPAPPVGPGPISFPGPMPPVGPGPIGFPGSICNPDLCFMNFQICMASCRGAAGGGSYGSDRSGDSSGGGGAGFNSCYRKAQANEKIQEDIRSIEDVGSQAKKRPLRFGEAQSTQTEETTWDWLWPPTRAPVVHIVVP